MAPIPGVPVAKQRERYLSGVELGRLDADPVRRAVNSIGATIAACLAGWMAIPKIDRSWDPSSAI